MARADITDGLGVPEMLTVAEAALILHIGRTAAYEMAKRWLETNGADGIPARRVGKLIRIPTAELEAHFGIRLTEHAAAIVRANRAKHEKRPKPRAIDNTGPQPRTARGRRPTSQHALPFTTQTDQDPRERSEPKRASMG